MWVDYGFDLRVWALIIMVANETAILSLTFMVGPFAFGISWKKG